MNIFFKRLLFLLMTILSIFPAFGKDELKMLSFEFYSGTVNLELYSSMIVDLDELNHESIQTFYQKLKNSNYQSATASLQAYKKKYQLNDWLYYQLIRKTAEQISPKSINYNRYTLYKWFLLGESDYDARLALSKGKLLLFVKCDEDIADIPYYEKDGQQFVCLNIHDYLDINLEKAELEPVNILYPKSKNLFSYRVTHLPDFKPESYTSKILKFKYGLKDYHFKVMLNAEVESIFKNYPGVNFETYFNIPLSRQTYSSLIPSLKKSITGMSQKKGVDYLMKFTRNAFLYETDEKNFGKERRLSPEQTLFNQYSDCDDRAALFFYLVKEIYQLPMIALMYPTHITMAVQFNKPLANSITYNGEQYSVCEPTPQKENLKIGQISSRLKNTAYTVVYQYKPSAGN